MHSREHVAIVAKLTTKSKLCRTWAVCSPEAGAGSASIAAAG